MILILYGKHSQNWEEEEILKVPKVLQVLKVFRVR